MLKKQCSLFMICLLLTSAFTPKTLKAEPAVWTQTKSLISSIAAFFIWSEQQDEPGNEAPEDLISPANIPDVPIQEDNVDENSFAYITNENGRIKGFFYWTWNTIRRWFFGDYEDTIQTLRQDVVFSKQDNTTLKQDTKKLDLTLTINHTGREKVLQIIEKTNQIEEEKKKLEKKIDELLQFTRTLLKKYNHLNRSHKKEKEELLGIIHVLTEEKKEVEKTLQKNAKDFESFTTEKEQKNDEINALKKEIEKTTSPISTVQILAKVKKEKEETSENLTILIKKTEENIIQTIQHMSKNLEEKENAIQSFETQFKRFIQKKNTRKKQTTPAKNSSKPSSETTSSQLRTTSEKKQQHKMKKRNSSTSKSGKKVQQPLPKPKDEKHITEKKSQPIPINKNRNEPSKKETSATLKKTIPPRIIKKNTHEEKKKKKQSVSEGKRRSLLNLLTDDQNQRTNSIPKPKNKENNAIPPKETKQPVTIKNNPQAAFQKSNKIKKVTVFKRKKRKKKKSRPSTNNTPTKEKTLISPPQILRQPTIKKTTQEEKKSTHLEGTIVPKEVSSQKNTQPTPQPIQKQSDNKKQQIHYPSPEFKMTIKPSHADNTKSAGKLKKKKKKRKKRKKKKKEKIDWITMGRSSYTQPKVEGQTKGKKKKNQKTKQLTKTRLSKTEKLYYTSRKINLQRLNVLKRRLKAKKRMIDSHTYETKKIQEEIEKISKKTAKAEKEKIKDSKKSFKKKAEKRKKEIELLKTKIFNNIKKKKIKKKKKKII